PRLSEPCSPCRNRGPSQRGGRPFMHADPVEAGATPPDRPDHADLAERLERGEVVYYPLCPFPLPGPVDLAFLLHQRLASRAHKNISYNPFGGKVAGYRKQSREQAERLRGVLA